MKAILGNFLAYFANRLPDAFALFLSILFFLLVSSYFVTEKGFFAKLLPTGIGFTAGFFGGGILGWFIGGIGIVAMGTGVGIGALGAIFVGAIAGAILGGLGGASFSFIQMMLNPSDFDVHWLGIIATLVASALVFFGTRYVIFRLSGMLRGR